MEIPQEMLDCVKHELDFMKTITTGDEAWVYVYDLEMKFQSYIITKAQKGITDSWQHEGNVDLIL